MKEPEDFTVGPLCAECRHGRMMYRRLHLMEEDAGKDPHEIDDGNSTPHERACEVRGLINGPGWYCDSCMFFTC